MRAKTVENRTDEIILTRVRFTQDQEWEKLYWRIWCLWCRSFFFFFSIVHRTADTEPYRAIRNSGINPKKLTNLAAYYPPGDL